MIFRYYFEIIITNLQAAFKKSFYFRIKFILSWTLIFKHYLRIIIISFNFRTLFIRLLSDFFIADNLIKEICEKLSQNFFLIKFLHHLLSYFICISFLTIIIMYDRIRVCLWSRCLHWLNIYNIWKNLLLRELRKKLSY